MSSERRTRQRRARRSGQRSQYLCPSSSTIFLSFSVKVSSLATLFLSNLSSNLLQFLTSWRNVFAKLRYTQTNIQLYNIGFKTATEGIKEHRQLQIPFNVISAQQLQSFVNFRFRQRHQYTTTSIARQTMTKEEDEAKIRAEKEE
uniref:Uncharacterized protein n=1 Tax=Globodera rostochiensis TaxID=31243 RepID=A0A914HZ27_GLORO